MRWLSYTIPLLFGVLVYLLIRFLKPRLKQQRHEAWRKAGLLPDQVDPHEPSQDTDDRTTGRRNSRDS